MSQNEAITALHIYQNIDPSFISLVWQKLEEQNPEFFKAYNIRLKVKEQITNFNFLISQQAHLMQKKMNTQKYEQQLKQEKETFYQPNIQVNEEQFFSGFPDFLDGDIHTDYLNTSDPKTLDPQQFIQTPIKQQHIQLQPQHHQVQQNVKIQQPQQQQHIYVQNGHPKEDNSIILTSEQSNPPTSGLFDLSENPLGLEDDIDSSYILPFGV